MMYVYVHGMVQVIKLGIGYSEYLQIVLIYSVIGDHQQLVNNMTLLRTTKVEFGLHQKYWSCMCYPKQIEVAQSNCSVSVTSGCNR